MKDERREIVRGLIECRSLQEIAGYLGCDVRRVREVSEDVLVQREVQEGREEWLKGVKEVAIGNARVRLERLEWIWGELVKGMGEKIDMARVRRMVEVLKAAKEEDGAESGVERIFEIGKWTTMGDKALEEEKARVMERIDKIACRMIERKGGGDEWRGQVRGEFQGEGAGGGERRGIRDRSEGVREGDEGSEDGRGGEG